MNLRASRIVYPLRISLRSLLKRWRTSLVVVVTLALGIGANAVIFSFIQGILLQPLPYPNADQLVRINSVRGGETGRISIRDASDLSQLTGLFQDIAVHSDTDGGYNLSGYGPPEEIPALLSSRNLFAVLGVQPVYGGTWPEEGDRLRNHSVVLGNGVWQRHWGGAEDALNATLTLDGAELYRVYGMMPAGFDYPGGVDIYRSIAFVDLDHEDRSARYYHGLGRLKPGVTSTQAQQALNTIARQLASEFPESNGAIEFQLKPLKELYVGDLRPYLLLLQVAVLLVLLIACVNIVHVLLAQALVRHRETAIRLALGAGQRQILRAWLLDCLLLSLAGCLLAVAVAYAGIHVLKQLLAMELPHWISIDVNAGVLIFTLVVSLLAGLVTALAPARQASRNSPFGSLGAGSRSQTSNRGQKKWHRLMVATQVALSIVLLIMASLLVKSFRGLERADMGFDPGNVLTFRVNLGWFAYDKVEKTRGYFTRLEEQLRGLPGVIDVAFNNNMPLGGVSEQRTIALPGQSEAERDQNPFVSLQAVSHSYFRMMGIGLYAGRAFDASDQPEGVGSVVINRRLAETLWPGRSPIGERLELAGFAEHVLQVVGVANNVIHTDVGVQPGLDLYVSRYQFPDHDAFVLVRSNTDPDLLLAAANDVALDIDPNQSTWQPIAMDQRIANAIWQERLTSRLVMVFALLAALLTAVGIYGVLSGHVRQRRREIAVRLAIGAQPLALLRDVFGDALRMVIVGLCVGLAAAIGAAYGLRSLLYQTSPFDPLILASSTLFLLVVAALSVWAPARIALQTEPAIMLREE
ncbi:MAG: ABC transporter permease [Pseudomonadota bacterium]